MAARVACWLLCLVAAGDDPVFLEGEDLTGVRLLERTVARIGRRHVGFSFACWLRVFDARREENGQPSARSTEAYEGGVGARWPPHLSSGRRRAEHASRGRGEGPRGALAESGFASHGKGVRSRIICLVETCGVRCARQRRGARSRGELVQSGAHAPRAHTRVAASWSGSTPYRGSRTSKSMLLRLLEQAIGRMVRGSVAGAFSWWQRVAANATAALLAKHRASRSLTRSMRRWARVSVAGSFAWWARATRDERALEDSKRLATQLFTRALERLARKSWTAAYLLWRKRTTDARNADSSRSQGALLVTRALRGARERRAVLQILP